MSEYQFNFPRKLTKKFILLYKENRCLWDSDDPSYRMKHKKKEAIAQLTELVRKHEPSVTRVHVLKKIESLRACVRREFRKVQTSREYATCEDEIHKPNLWYYDLLVFLFDGSLDNKSRRTPANVSKTENEEITDAEDDDDNGIAEYIDNDDEHEETFDVEYQPDYRCTVNVEEVDQPSSSVKHVKANEQQYTIKRAKVSSTEVDDEYDAIGINVAAKLRNLPSNMRIVAEKLINDVLFQAQINGLNSSTKLVTSDPFKNETSSTTY